MADIPFAAVRVGRQAETMSMPAPAPLRFRAGLLAALLVLAGASAAVADWPAPKGVPVPPFGVSDVAPARPDPWDGSKAGFVYVDAGAPGATDSGNPQGWPGRPRATIPRQLTAGTVVELHGLYDVPHSSPNGIVALGTVEHPVYIRGAGPDERPAITREWEVSGAYFVLEHLEFRARADKVTTGSLIIQAPVSHAVLRYSDLSGTLDGGGLGIESWDGRSAVGPFVVRENRIHDNGNAHANFDQDRHGIHVGARVHHLWVVDNELFGNSGDGIQISARTAADQASTHHIYVARNVSHHNKQNGFWVKQANDVIFSENTSYGNRPSNSSMGAGLGFQYAPDYVWFLFNHVYDSDYGILAGSDSDLGRGTESFYIGNVIHGIHTSTGGFKPGTAWHNCGISLAGGINRYVVNNTLYDVDSGVCSPDAAGKVEISDNLVFVVRPDGQHVFLEQYAVAEASKAEGNVFGPNYRGLTGGVQREFKDEGRALNAVARIMGIVGEGAQPFDLRDTSPAIDAGVADPGGVYARFKQRYGIDIQVDYLSRPRPVGAGWDAGAFEFQGVPAAAGAGARGAPAAKRKP